MRSKLLLDQISKAGKLVWTGKDFKYGEINILSNPTFENAIEKALSKDELSPKDEFETTSEFENRKKDFENRKEKEKSNILNSWLGNQSLNLEYNADNEFFNLSINSFLKFQLSVPRSSAKEFKATTKHFNIFFEEKKKKLYIVGAEAGGFSTELNIELTEKILEREREIYRKTISIDNLMFQDFDLPGRMNWDDACTYCKNLRLLGFSDWRLPEIGELKIAYKHKSKFKNIKSEGHWSSTEHNRDKWYSWKLNFSNGNDNSNDQSGSYYVRCVR
jgi:hypothetical protein